MKSFTLHLTVPSPSPSTPCLIVHGIIYYFYANRKNGNWNGAIKNCTFGGHLAVLTKSDLLANKSIYWPKRHLASESEHIPFCVPMAHTMETFIYSPLDRKHEIRLSRLQPHQFSSSDEIECELLQVNLDTKPHYEALSYGWGPPANSPFWISVDGKLYQVRENLSDALRDLRGLDQTFCSTRESLSRDDFRNWNCHLVLCSCNT